MIRNKYQNKLNEIPSDLLIDRILDLSMAYCEESWKNKAMETTMKSALMKIKSK